MNILYKTWQMLFKIASWYTSQDNALDIDVSTSNSETMLT
jgi:hypothetical protein